MPEAVVFAGRSQPHATVRGFTLIELMVTVALLAILMMLAAPSLTRFQRSSQLVSTTNAFVGALTAARAEAMKRNRNAFVTPKTGNDWTTGWQVFVDMNGDGAFASGSDLLVTSEDAIPSAITTPADGVSQFLAGGVAYVRFNGSGFPRRSGDAFSSDSIEFSNVEFGLRRRVILSPAGRFWVCTPPDAACTQ